MLKCTTNSLLPSLMLALLVVFNFSCVDKLVLPEDLNTAEDFFAGDTSYLQVNPIWDQFQTPVEISIAPDGFIFVADSAAHGIAVLEQSGMLAGGYEALAPLVMGGQTLAPIDVDIDYKMNVMFIDGTNRIYRWNQYWNQVGIDSVLVSADFRDQADNVFSEQYGGLNWISAVNSTQYTMENQVWSSSQALIDSLLAPHVFYDASTVLGSYYDIYVNTDQIELSALTTVKDDRNRLFTTDFYHNRIIEIHYLRNALLALSDGNLVWSHAGTYIGTVEDAGAGSGKVAHPTGIDIDFENNLYYSQIDCVFMANKIKYNDGDWISSFSEAKHEIARRFLFSNPLDIAVDENQMIYVANTMAREVQVFTAKGEFFKKAGVEESWMNQADWDPADPDLVLVDSTETEYLVEEKTTFRQPAGITVDSRGVIYVCDPQLGAVFRFRLSNMLDEDLQPN